MTQSQPTNSYSEADVRTIAFMAAGLASGEVMRRAPHVVMPTEDITAGVEQILADARDGVIPDMERSRS
jgi:hypothetical protein